MPPRRSSRSTRASVELAPVPEAITVKRKRGSAVEPSEKENVVSSRRRSTSAKSTGKSRTSSRTKKPLEQVVETDSEHEEEDAPPPVKKTRPSLGPEEGDGSDLAMDIEEKPKIDIKKDSDDESEEEENGVHGVSSKRVSAPSRGISSAKSNTRGRSVRGRVPSKVQNPSQDDSENEEFLEEESDESTKPVSKPKGRKSRPSVKKEKSSTPKPPSRSSKLEPIVERQHVIEEADEDDEEDIPISQPRRREAGGESIQRAGMSSDEEDGDEDQSLLDTPIPHPVSQPVSQTQQFILEEPKGPISRLVIHKIVMINFKSYAGRQVIGPFHKSFSAIVGANGSGKSNTIDALLFVFGYRATKMRQGKLSELIHNSAAYPDLEECSVEVHFRDIIDLPGDDEYEDVPGSNLIVSRFATKHNGNGYTIDKKTSSYKEVQGLLKGRGIDLDHNRFLILQGEVESIAQMKPKGSNEHEDGLLEYLEDIIGTSQYKEPLEKGEEEIELLNQESAAQRDRARNAEKRLNGMKAQKKEADSYLRLKNELARARHILYQWHIWKLLQQHERCSIEIQQVATDLQAEQDQNRTDIDFLESLEKDYKERLKDYEIVRKESEHVSKELSQHEKQHVSANERLKAVNSKIKATKKKIHEANTKFNGARQTIIDSDEKITQAKTELSEHESSLAVEEKILRGIEDSLRDKTQVFYDKITDKQKELLPWTTKINDQTSQIKTATTERDSLQKQALELQAALDEADTNLEQLNKDLAQKLQNQQELRERRKQISEEISATERTLLEERSTHSEWAAKASTAHNVIQQAKSSQAESKSQNKVLDSLKRLRSSGRVKGFHGRLGELGTIPDEYDVAVSTACPGLRDMVVDTVRDAQDCIQHLREQAVGRSSFIVLEKMGVFNMSPIQTPENVHRLFDLITCKEPHFAPAFYQKLRDTLVVKDLDQANRIAFGASKRWRVVTLAGELFDISGTMAGGGGNASRGLMSSRLPSESIDPTILRKHEADYQDATQKVTNAAASISAAEAKIENFKTQIPAIEVQYEKLGMEVTVDRRRVIDAQKRRDQLAERTKPNVKDKARIQKLENEIVTGQAELDKLQQHAEEINNAIQELNDKIGVIGGSRLKVQQSKVEGIKNLHALATDEITRAEVAKGSAESEVVKHKLAVDTNTQSLDSHTEEAETHTKELEEISAIISELTETVENARTVEETSKDKLNDIKEQLDAKTEEVQEFRRKEAKLQQKLNDLKTQSKSYDNQMKEFNDDINKLKLEVIDDDDEDGGEEDGKDDNDDIKPDPEDDLDDVKPEPVDIHPTNGFKHYTVIELKQMKQHVLTGNVELLDEKLQSAKPNLGILEEFKKAQMEWFKRSDELNAANQQRDEKKREFEALALQRKTEFMAGFSAISMKLKEMYQMITLGGNAELELVDSLDPFSEGIIFSVMPPKKSWKTISNLSGGEKTLSSLALVFALHVYKPTPLYFMDEIDAALDFKNVSIVANYIKDRTKNAQFIIISLRNDMFELSHRLIGIYKTANTTKSVTVANDSLAQRPPRNP